MQFTLQKYSSLLHLRTFVGFFKVAFWNRDPDVNIIDPLWLIFSLWAPNLQGNHSHNSDKNKTAIQTKQQDYSYRNSSSKTNIRASPKVPNK